MIASLYEHFVLGALRLRGTSLEALYKQFKFQKQVD